MPELTEQPLLEQPISLPEESLEATTKRLVKITSSIRTSRKQERRRRHRAHARFDWDAPRESQDAESRSEQRLAAEYGWPKIEEIPVMRASRWNPYEEFWRLYDGNSGWLNSRDTFPDGFGDPAQLSAILGVPRSIAGSVGRFAARSYATSFFAWAVPNQAAIDAIAKLDRPVLELGAGRGYWAWQLRQAGVETVAFEPALYRETWTETVARKPDKWRRDYALLFCWPTYDDPWAARLLNEHKGDTVLYVGEGDGGCTADGRFHELLSRRYSEVATIQIPQWYGIHDWLTIWRRKFELVANAGKGHRRPL